MGVIDDFKEDKNKNTIITASIKMIKDKYNINIEHRHLKQIIENIIISLCNDAILIKNVVKLIELNTIALTKIKEYIENNIINKNEDTSHTEHIEKPIERELLINKYNTEDLLSKVLELEEKRKIVNTLANLDTIKDQEMQSSIINSENTERNKNNFSYTLVNNTNTTTDNIELVAYIIEKMESIINNKKNISYKNLIINSYNRDWTIYNNRNDLSLSINIDLNKNIIEPKKLLMPNYIKNITPYITMSIDDNKKTQKFQFILSNKNTISGGWDTWDIINNEYENLNNFITLNNKNWIISFTDFLNNNLNLGTDNINICKISKNIKDNHYDITIDMKDIILFKEYYLEYNNKYDNILLKTNEDEDIVLKIVEINNNIITVLSDTNILDYVDGTLLNFKAQYTIILKYHSKIAK